MYGILRNSYTFRTFCMCVDFLNSQDAGTPRGGPGGTRGAAGGPQGGPRGAPRGLEGPLGAPWGPFWEVGPVGARGVQVLLNYFRQP